MEKDVIIDKVNAYLGSRFFPWNFLLEPVNDGAIRHYIKFAIPVALKMAETLDSQNHFSVKQSIGDEIWNIANDYLIDPYNEHAKRIHGKFADDYPFAYGQCYVFSMLFALMLELEDMIDVISLLDVMGVSEVSFIRKKELIEKLAVIHRKETLSGILSSKIVGRKVIYKSNASDFGVLHDIIISTNHSYFLDLIVKPIKNNKDSPFKKAGKFVYIPANEVRLINAYNNHIVIDF